MSSRVYPKLTTTSIPPADSKLGDRYYDPVANQLYELLPVNGTTVGWVQIPLANSVFAQANAAFTVANNALANTGTAVTANGSTIYTFANTQASTSNTTGSLVINGGLGVSGNVYASGLYFQNNAVGYLNIPQNAQTTAYTLTIADIGKHMYMASGQAATTFTIPANSSVPFPIGTAINFVNMSVNGMTLSFGDTVYLSSSGSTSQRVVSQYGFATALKITSTTWIISGTGVV